MEDNYAAAQTLLQSIKESVNTFTGPDEIDVKEILPDVWRIGGYIGADFFLKAPSSNVIILRDGDTAYIVDPGFYPKYQDEILKVIDTCKKRGVTKVRLLVTQGHFDHDTNDDVITKTGLDYEFYLPEAEVPTMDAAYDFMRDLDNLSRYEDVYQTMFPDDGLGFVIKSIAKDSPYTARKILSTAIHARMSGGNNLAEQAKMLRNHEKISRRYGSVTLSGWELGRFFLIHDGAHSPGHICIYDPQYKMVLPGDVTIEVNPAFFYSSMNALIEISGQLRTMAQEGYIQYAADAHRSPEYMAELWEALPASPVDQIQMIEWAHNPSECERFFDFFYTYYRELRREVIECHRRIGRATVGDIVREMRKTGNPYVEFKAAMVFPNNIPSRMDVLVANVLSEQGAIPVTVAGKILIDPVPPPPEITE